MPGMLCSQAARGAQRRMGLHRVVEPRVEVGQVLGQPGQVGVEVGPERWRGLVAPLLLGHADGEELAPPGNQGVQVLGGRIRARTQRRLDLGGEAGQHPGVEPVGLGQDVAAAGEVAHLPRIDHHRRQPGRDERGVHGPLVAAAGLQHEARGLERPRAVDQRGVARGRVGDAPGVLGRMHRDIQMIAGDVQAEIRGLGHFGTLP